MTACRAGCLHRLNVMEYQAARHADELAREQQTAGYAAETRDYSGSMITFQAWLTGRTLTTPPPNTTREV